MERTVKWCKWIHRITMAVTFLSILLPVIFWRYIPAKIPQHYGGSGEIDAWTDKSFLILLFVIILFMLGIMSITEYYVKSSAMSEHASDQEKGNIFYIYPMIVVLDLIMESMFAYIIFCAAFARTLGKLFLPLTLTATFGPMLFFFWKDYNMKKSDLGLNDDTKKELAELEKTQAGECYRTKIDWWIGILLILCVAFPVPTIIKSWMNERQADWVLIGTELFMLVLFVPLFRIKYILYPEYMVISCFGKNRIYYKWITELKETHNPLSSAAMSLDRLEIHYRNDRGGRNMALISPVRKKEFIKKVQEKKERSD